LREADGAASAAPGEASPRAGFFVVTRFNLYSPAFRGSRSDQEYEDWCARRVALCRAITIPSLAAQRMKRFRWLVLMDVETNGPLDDFVRGLAALPFAEVLTVDLRGARRDAMPAAVSRHIRATIAPRMTHVCTTRLDSDDALHSRHLAALARAVGEAQAAVGAAELTRFQLPYSLRWNGRALQVGIYPRGQFASVVEPLMPGRPLRTAYFDKHTAKLPNDVIVSTRFPATLTCVHAGNLLNRMLPHDLTVVDEGDLIGAFGIDRAQAERLLAD
jgi:hypothetical protein